MTHMFIMICIPPHSRMRSWTFRSLWHKIPRRRTRSRLRYENPVTSLVSSYVFTADNGPDATGFPKLIRGRKRSKSRSDSSQRWHKIATLDSPHATYLPNFPLCLVFRVVVRWRKFWHSSGQTTRMTLTQQRGKLSPYTASTRQGLRKLSGVWRQVLLEIGRASCRERVSPYV